MDLPSPSICLEACSLNIVLLYFHSAEEPHPVEKSCRKGSLQALETENSVTSFCTSLQQLFRPQKNKGLLFQFRIWRTRPLPLESFAGTHRQFLDVQNPRSCSFACLPHHVMRKCTHRRTQYVLRNLDPPATSACIVEQIELYSPCLFLTIVGRAVGDMGKVSIFGVKSAKQLYDGLQQWPQHLVASVLGLI